MPATSSHPNADLAPTALLISAVTAVPLVVGVAAFGPVTRYLSGGLFTVGAAALALGAGWLFQRRVTPDRPNFLFVATVLPVGLFVLLLFATIVDRVDAFVVFLPGESRGAGMAAYIASVSVACIAGHALGRRGGG